MAEKVKITGWTKCPFNADNTGVFGSVNRIWYSPDNRKAVLEVWKSELYVAVNIKERNKEYLLCDYVDHYECLIGLELRYFYGVEWKFLEYGFCKLKSCSIDTGEKFVKRFCFK